MPDLDELRKDEAQILAQLQQAQGILMYLRAKIAEAEKKEAEAPDDDKDPGKNGAPKAEKAKAKA